MKSIRFHFAEDSLLAPRNEKPKPVVDFAQGPFGKKMICVEVI
jgi:hypothetical protein